MGSGESQPLEENECTGKVESRAGNQATSAAPWTQETANKLQAAVDEIFGEDGGQSLLGLEFSFTIADPSIEDCPLIGCSTGFTKLCGYELDDIVGQNCRFLTSPVPKDQIDWKVRKHVRDFCEAVRQGKEYRRPECDLEDWMPRSRPADELVCKQVNARKDGTLFYNMFYLKVFDISLEMGDERPFIIGLQSELPDNVQTLSRLTCQLDQLDEKMSRVKDELSAIFFVHCSMTRAGKASLAATEYGKKDGDEDTDGVPEPEEPIAPDNLYEAFTKTEVRPWEEGKFTHVKKLRDATRNRGVVELLKDEANGKVFAAKQMPNTWVCDSHEEFMRAHPTEMELPWQDIGCTRFLNTVNYKHACKLEGVYRSDESTFVLLTFANGGDLFDLAQQGQRPGPERELALARLVIDLLNGVKILHNMQIVHRDISLENVLLTSGEVAKTDLLIIDYGMASTERTFTNATGKASYQAPEMHTRQDHDAFLCDAFAVGVVLYCLFVKDYPWLSTKPGRCKCFDFYQKKGFRAYCAKRTLRGSDARIDECMSEPFLSLVEGMLHTDPDKRLTLGEKGWTNRRSVWDEPFVLKCKELASH
jgi:hypothetical protein